MSNNIEAAEMIEAEIKRLYEHKANMERVQAALTRDGFPSRDLEQRLEELNRIIELQEENARFIRKTAE